MDLSILRASHPPLVSCLLSTCLLSCSPWFLLPSLTCPLPPRFPFRLPGPPGFKGHRAQSVLSICLADGSPTYWQGTSRCQPAPSPPTQGAAVPKENPLAQSELTSAVGQSQGLKIQVPTYPQCQPSTQPTGCAAHYTDAIVATVGSTKGTQWEVGNPERPGGG